jgi:uncharacterized damage-inducible protein DinB
MKITELIATHILEAYEGNNWTDVSIADTLNNVRWQEAQCKTAGSLNTIASLLHHLCFWNGILLQRLSESDPAIPEINGFDVKELKNEDDWFRLKEETRDSFVKLADAAKNFPEEKLSEFYAEGKSSHYKNLAGIVEHAYYHLGQIMILKKLVKNI